MPPILLATINAKWIHPSLALRLLKANLGALEDRSALIEFALRQPLNEKVDPIIAARPQILGLSVSIWNHAATLELLAELERAWQTAATPRPVIILGGPEVSHLPPDAALFRHADYVIRGEGEIAFRTLCGRILAEGRHKPAAHCTVIDAEPVNVAEIQSAYHLYTGEDIQKKLIYVEASRGCPFNCEFCLSAVRFAPPGDAPVGTTQAVREFPLERFLADMDELIRRGGPGKGRTFKFLDRTFNLHIDRARRIMEFFLDKIEEYESFRIQSLIAEKEPLVIPEPSGTISTLLRDYYTGTQGWRNKILDWAETLLPEKINTPDGEVYISRSTIRDSIAHGKGPLKIAPLPYLAKIIINGVLFYTEKKNDKQGRPFVYYNYAYPLIFKGNRYLSSITIKQDYNGRRYYDNEFIQEIKPTDELANAAGPSTRGSLTHPSIKSILHKILTVKPGAAPLTLHFEMVPSRFPPELRETLARFPPGTLRLEIGIQTLNGDVSARIGRPADTERELETLRFLRERTTAIIHADLIAGLPGEDMASFGRGFDRLWSALLYAGTAATAAARPCAEIQIGILKLLPGAPIARHTEACGMRYSPTPPYEVLETAAIPAADMERLKNFARFWELIVNRGLADCPGRQDPAAHADGASVFERFMALSDTLLARFGRNWGIDKKALQQALRYSGTQALAEEGPDRI